MREIKFRAWIVPTKRMVDVSGFCFQTKGVAVECLKIGKQDLDNKEDQEFWWNEKEAIVIQFTGLKDKNGKEIYEGDIVAVPYVSPSGQTLEVDRNVAVGFEFGRFVLLEREEPKPITKWCPESEGPYVSNYGNLKILSNKTLLEVVGNIYENADLLKR